MTSAVTPDTGQASQYLEPRVGLGGGRGRLCRRSGRSAAPGPSMTAGSQWTISREADGQVQLGKTSRRAQGRVQ